MKVKLTKEGTQLYFGTADCGRTTFVAIKIDEHYGIRGIDLIMAGADKRLIVGSELYVFEENEVEIVE